MTMRNITFFNYPTSLDLSDIAEQAAQCALKPVGPNELASVGFVHPFGEDEGYAPNIGGGILQLAVGIETKVLPAAAIERLLGKKVREIEKAEGRVLGGRARRRIKEEIIFDLLPKALVKPARIDVVINPARGLAIVGASSKKQAELVISQLRYALGSFPALPAYPTVQPSAVMTDWVASEVDMPAGIVLADECELRDPADTASVVRVKYVDLSSKELDEHLTAGRRVTKLRVAFENLFEVTIDEAMVCRSIVPIAEFGDDEGGDGDDSLNYLLARMYTQLYDAVASAFKFAEDIE